MYICTCLLVLELYQRRNNTLDFTLIKLGMRGRITHFRVRHLGTQLLFLCGHVCVCVTHITHFRVRHLGTQLPCLCVYVCACVATSPPESLRCV